MKEIKNLDKLNEINFDAIGENTFWNERNKAELKIHKVHVYPAKFPSLIAQKAFQYAEQHNVKVNRVADVFCGCGTVAVESKIAGFDFWGCDINPVAVLLSKVKTQDYVYEKILKLSNAIEECYKETPFLDIYDTANERLKYWFNKSQYNDLYHLKSIIDSCKMSQKYRELFWCVFSSILKRTSKWLTKSIKPQVDPQKESVDVLTAFHKQVQVYATAIKEMTCRRQSKINIQHKNVLNISKKDYVDLIVTSPPYVTSYEYADLHQLSSLWLGYAEDYKDLRKDSIGSLYENENVDTNLLVDSAKKILSNFQLNAQGKSIARYYLQMQKVVKVCYRLLHINGLCVFVIGDTEYKGVKIENAKCLAESMLREGFIIEEITKRRIENKFLPSHRSANGKFSSNSSDKTIYSQEYIIIGRKLR